MSGLLRFADLSHESRRSMPEHRTGRSPVVSSHRRLVVFATNAPQSRQRAAFRGGARPESQAHWFFRWPPCS